MFLSKPWNFHQFILFIVYIDTIYLFVFHLDKFYLLFLTFGKLYKNIFPSFLQIILIWNCLKGQEEID